MAALDVPSPTLVRWLELLASILDLRDGRLELVFRGGRLETWGTASRERRPLDLRAYDGFADELLQRTRQFAPTD